MSDPASSGSSRLSESLKSPVDLLSLDSEGPDSNLTPVSADHQQTLQRPLDAIVQTKGQKIRLKPACNA